MSIQYLNQQRSSTGLLFLGGMRFSDDPRVVKRSDFGWRMRERFLSSMYW
ncbi:hypothetical protein [Nostoc sp. ChiSLP03a]|nr:hypothetical protein [Nostoc sp. ChiSLP03a]MDZ8211670.1 hypothetical protein [Nostoc sp. ChiSLP03a]